MSTPSFLSTIKDIKTTHPLKYRESSNNKELFNSNTTNLLLWWVNLSSPKKLQFYLLNDFQRLKDEKEDESEIIDRLKNKNTKIDCINQSFIIGESVPTRGSTSSNSTKRHQLIWILLTKPKLRWEFVLFSFLF